MINLLCNPLGVPTEIKSLWNPQGVVEIKDFKKEDFKEIFSFILKRKSRFFYLLSAENSSENSKRPSFKEASAESVKALVD